LSQFLDSIHGLAASKGNTDVPVCDTCHPEHPRAARMGVAQRGVVATCISCHEDPGLQQEYAIPGNRLASYMGSYHGAATQLGDSRTADCASCHGEHLILPSANPRSSVNPKNLPETCGRCHPGAGTHFAQGRVHLQPGPKRDRLVFWVKIGYQIFIIALMSGFLGYICLDLLARIRGKFGRNGRHAPVEGEPQFQRLTLNQRIQHWALITSFTTLMITGLPLASPRLSISQSVVTFLGGMGARAVIHRIAAVALIAIVVYHLLYVLFSRKGYWEFQQLLPGLLDARDVVIMLGFYLGFTPVRAQFGRYNFIEKFEYLAVGWGSVVMIGTGAMLWAPQISLMFLPKWTMDVALIVHSWEAIMAFLAIIIWHMYNVHWNPSVFPMSRVWLTGKIGLREFQENHPLEYEQYLRGPAQSEGRQT
jgi:cytochrome b subunit of formate dehydrogenase